MSTTQKVISKFEDFGQLRALSLLVQERSGRSLENIAAANESVAKNMKPLVRYHLKQLKSL